jgi:raffinose/stachyose/melibiose transport system permease protein
VKRTYPNLMVYMFALPALLVYTFLFITLIWANFYISLTKWNGFSNNIAWVGLRNYSKLFQDNQFYQSLSHNLLYTLTVIVLQLSFALLFALILYKRVKGQNIFKVIFLLPVILSNVTLGLMWSYMLDPMMGFVNVFLNHVGLGVLATSWLGNQHIALYSVAFVNAWQYIGYSMIIFIAGLQTIPDSLFEAAKIDGANRWYIFRHVIIPLLAPAFTINIVLTTVGSFKVFDLIYIMTQGGPNRSTEVLATMAYKAGFNYSEMGYASAITTILFVFIMIIGFIQIKVLRNREITY